MKKLLTILALCLGLSAAHAQTITQATAGSWCSTSTWTGGVVPTTGNQVVMLNGGTLTVPFGCVALVGTSPADCTTPAITQGTGTLINNGALYFKGCLAGGNAPITFGPGAVTVFDSSAAASPTHTKYQVLETAATQGAKQATCSGTSGTSPSFTGTTTAGSPVVTVSSTTGLQDGQYIDSAAFPNGGVIAPSGVGVGTITMSVNASVSLTSTPMMALTTFSSNASGSPGNFMDTNGNAMPVTCKYAAFVNMGDSHSFTGTTTASSTTITGVSSTAGLAPGDFISGTGIPNGDTIAPGGVGVGTLTLSVAASSGATSTMHAWTNAVTLNPNTGTAAIDFENVFFDTSGAVAITHAVPAGYAVTFKNNTCRNEQDPSFGCLKLLGANSPTADRTIQHNVFTGQPNIVGQGFRYSQNYFYNSFTVSSFTQGWALFDDSFMRVKSSVSSLISNLQGDFTNPWVVLDRSIASPLFSGTVSSASTTSTVTTINFAGTPFTAHAFKSAATGPGLGDFTLCVLSGTYAKHCTSITDNTTSALSGMYNFPVDNTSNIAIYEGQFNPHWVQAGLAQNATYGGTGGGIGVFESLMSDNNGDCYLNLPNGATWTVTYNLFLPNAMRDTSCTPHTLFGGTAKIAFTHNTSWPGAQSTAVGEGTATPAGSETTYKNNLFADDPAMAAFYYASGGAGATAPSTFGPAMFNDEQCSGVTNTDIIVAGQAQFNGGWGLKNLTCSGITNPLYRTKTTVTPGANDISADPQYVDSSKGFRQCAMDAGAPGDWVAAGDYAFAQMKLMNSVSFNTNFSIANLKACVINGWKFKNVIYHNAGSDGLDIGATPYAPPFPVSLALTPLPFSVPVGGTQALACTATLSDGSTRPAISPVLVSSDPTKASTSGLVVTGVAPGTGTINCNAESLTTLTPDPFTVTSATPNTYRSGNTFASGGTKIQ